MYDIPDEATFDRLVEPYMPSLGPSFLGLDAAHLTHQAWILPTSAWGSLAAGILAVQAVKGGDQVPPNAYGNQLVPWGQNYSQEQSMSLVISNAYLGVISAACGGHEIVNVVGMQGSGPGQEAAAAAALQVAWESSGKPISRLPYEYTLTGYEVTDLSSTSGGIATISSTTAGGLTAVDVSTRAACALVKWNGGSRDRSTRGRMYFGPLSEDQIASDGATIPTTPLGDLTTAFTQFVNSLASAGFPLGVISRKYSKITLVGSFSVEPLVATQRRRLRK